MSDPDENVRFIGTVSLLKSFTPDKAAKTFANAKVAEHQARSSTPSVIDAGNPLKTRCQNALNRSHEMVGGLPETH